MIEAPGWNLKKDETIYKAAGAAHLRKYGQFFDNLANNCWQGSSSLEYIIEGPLRLVYKVNEDVSLLSLAETENKIFSKLLASVVGTCREIRLLKAEASKFYNKLFSHGERCADQADYKIETLLSDLQDLSMYVNRISMVIHLTVRQLANLANNNHREIYLPLLIEHLLDLFVILVTLDEVTSGQPALVERWKVYRVKVRSVVHNSAQLNISEERILTYERLLKDLHLQLLSKNLFARAVEHVMDVNKTTTMCDHMLCFLRNTLTDVESKIGPDGAAATANRGWIQTTVGLVVVARLFGSCDKKLLRRLVEVNRKLYAVTLAGNVMWPPNDWLAEQLPRESVTAVPRQVGERVLAARVQRLPGLLHALAQRAMLWSAEMQTLLIKTGFEIFSEIEKKRNLLLEVVALMRQLKESATLVTNLHALLLRPMSRSVVQLVCRLLEVHKALETSFHTLASTVVLSQAQVLQQLTYQILAILESVRRALTQRDRGYARERLDALALLGAGARLANGPASWERRLVLRCALVCASQLTESFREEEVVRLRYYLDTYDTVVELSDLVLDSCDYSLLLHQRGVLPAYLQLELEGGAGLGHLAHLLDALNSAGARAHEGELATDERRELLARHVLEPACREIETGLRLHVHSHLKLDSTNPWLVGARDGARVTRCPGLPTGPRRLCLPRRFVEHYLDATFYNLTTVALHDWKTYRSMHALARHKLRLETVHNHLPTQTLEQGLDALEIMRNIHLFVARYHYDLHAQTFVEGSSGGKHLNTIGIRHVANSIRTHGSGIMSTSVNFVYQFLRLKLHTLSQFLFDEHIKSRLMRDARFVRAQKERSAATAPYPYERADKFQKGIRKLGMSADGLSYLDQFRQLVTHIGNALGYVRLIRSAGLHASSNAISFLPADVAGAEDSALLPRLCDEAGFSAGTRSAAARLEDDIANLRRNFTEGIHYFKLLVDVFAEAFRDQTKAHHLQQFYAIVPPLTLSFVDNAVANKEKLFKKNKGGAAFTDDGFVVGVAYINALLDQSRELDSLQWFRTVEQYFDAETAAATGKLEDEKLQQTRALTLNRLRERRDEFQLLYYSLSGARGFFKQPDTS